jgi:hypothetical protein
MPVAPLLTVSAAVEGDVDEAVVRALLRHVGAAAGEVYGKQGKQHIQQRIRGYNNAAMHGPWIVLVDLDRDAECAPPLRASWLPGKAVRMCFRIAVRQTEAWLLADRERLASFLAVSASRIPLEPERLQDSKEAMVNLARSSRRVEIREDMVPRPESGRRVGPAYSSRLIEFVGALWRPERAATRSDSLRRCITCLGSLVRAETSS